MFQATARIPTTKGSRYLQQLCKHWAHNLAVEFTPLQGTVIFPRDARGADWPGDATLTLQADADSLDCRLEASSDEHLDAMKGRGRASSRSLRLPRGAAALRLAQSLVRDPIRINHVHSVVMPRLGLGIHEFHCARPSQWKQTRGPQGQALGRRSLGCLSGYCIGPAKKRVEDCPPARYVGGMSAGGDFEIFMATAPGLESVLCAEAKEKKFKQPTAVQGGVTVQGGWPEVWRANLEIRGASRIWRASPNSAPCIWPSSTKRAHKVDWAAILRRDVPFCVEASCKKSRIYHQGAAAQRVETAIRDQVGAPVDAEAAVSIKVRIDDDLCTISVDTSGELLHKRGHKEEVAKAPMAGESGGLVPAPMRL